MSQPATDAPDAPEAPARTPEPTPSRTQSHAAHHGPRTPKELTWVSLGALGVVYGDIGTSPLYAMRECFSKSNPHAASPGDPTAVYGVLSLFFWSLLLVVVIKYLVFVLRADNKGEGGTLALAALVQQGAPDAAKRRTRLAIPILLALFGTGLLYGEGLITPAISVMSAVEGLSEQSPRLSDLVVPISGAILVALFWVQRYGTGRIGSVFGWIMLVWFIAIAVAGVPYIAREPEILRALSPHYGAVFLASNGAKGFLLLGSVVLCITGCEALYADMGHFGRTPIRLAWSTIVFPALVINYFGQGGLLLEQKTHVTNPFFSMVPDPLLIPMIILATLAAIIASQALISGAFSITNQAVQLGYLPRVTVIHTSHRAEGQIYIPEVNYALMVSCLALVLSFKSSENLAAAYGIAVTGTMSITSFLFFRVCVQNWKVPVQLALLLYVPLVIIDLSFFSANVVKIAAGGWFPLAVGVAMFTVMTTWWRGRTELSTTMALGSIPDEMFLADFATTNLPRVPGTAVFMASSVEGVPNVLMHHVKHNKVMHKQVVLLSVLTENVPYVLHEPIAVRELGHGFYRVVARFGFMQQPNVPKILAKCEKFGLIVNGFDTTYYLGRQTLLTTGRSKVAKWRKMLYAFLARNSVPPTNFFQLPPNRVVELGLQIEL
jgi:KUP system potassium uptake protein